MGKSRSATALCAYLMASRKIGRDEALAVIQQTRPFVEPNAGFMLQLTLWEKMGCPRDVETHPVYQRWVYETDVAVSAAAGRAPDKVHFRDAEVQAQEATKAVELRCKKCRYVSSSFGVPGGC